MGQIDYLTTCPDLGEIIPKIKDYESDLYKIILKDFNDQPIARYIVQPSFGPEYAFQIQQDQDDNYVLLANCLITSLWDCDNRDTIQPIQYINNIGKELTEAISNLFQILLQPVNGPCYGSGQDGITYRLYIYDTEKGLLCGETWSPKKGSKMFEIISFCDATLDYARSPCDKAKNDLIKQIDSLLVMLKIMYCAQQVGICHWLSAPRELSG